MKANQSRSNIRSNLTSIEIDNDGYSHDVDKGISMTPRTVTDQNITSSINISSTIFNSIASQVKIGLSQAQRG